MFPLGSTQNIFYESYLPISCILLCTIDDTYTKRFSACMMVDNKQRGKCEVKIVIYMSKVSNSLTISPTPSNFQPNFTCDLTCVSY